jgi:hypothetical protein
MLFIGVLIASFFVKSLDVAFVSCCLTYIQIVKYISWDIWTMSKVGALFATCFMLRTSIYFALFCDVVPYNFQSRVEFQFMV